MTAPPPDWMVVSAVRYALGRATYITATTAAWLVENWAALPEGARRTVRHDVEAEFDRDDRARARGQTERLPLGWDCDRAEWAAVRALWQTPPPTPEDTTNDPP